MPHAVVVRGLAEELGVGRARRLDSEPEEKLRPQDGRGLRAAAHESLEVIAHDLAAVLGERRELVVEDIVGVREPERGARQRPPDAP